MGMYKIFNCLGYFCIKLLLHLFIVHCIRLQTNIFSEFCGNEMSDKKFARKVARLNSNVLHLCFTQNTNITVLHPMHTLQNLLHLLNTEISDLGR